MIYNRKLVEGRQAEIQRQMPNCELNIDYKSIHVGHHDD